MHKTVKLIKKTATQLIGQIFPGLDVAKDDAPPDAAIYRASTGPEGLEIRCENDWYSHNRLIKLTVCDGVGGDWILHYYRPDTLERDFEAEQTERKEAAIEARKEWVGEIGPDMAHRLVDSYWEGREK